MSKWKVLSLFALVLGGWGCESTIARQHAAEIRELRARGRELFMGRGGCNTCHKLGEEGKFITAPNLGVGDGMAEVVGVRAKARRPELEPIEYVVESIVLPDAVVTPGYVRGIMKPYWQPPISLSDDEIIALAAFVAGEGEGAPPIDHRQVELARKRLAAVKPAP
jgi:hypothetical protein